jgi:hypothetical protein
MKKARFTDEQIVRILQEADRDPIAAVDQLNREEFAILDEILAARKEVGLSQTQIAKRMSTQAPAIAD